jgi:anti-sigma B factor antagonist
MQPGNAPIKSCLVEITPGKHEGQRVMRLSGPLVQETIFDFQNQIRSEASPAVVIDLSEVPYIDSAGLGSLVLAAVHFNKSGRRLALAGMSQRAVTLFQMSHLDRFFTTYPNRSAAEDALK